MPGVRTVTETIDFEGEPFTLLFDWEVIAHFEETWSVSIGDVLNPPGGGSPMVSRLAKLFLSALLPNHPDADLNLAGAMMASPGVQEKFFGALNRSMPQAGDTGDEGNVPKPNRATRRAAKSRSAGKTG